MLITELVNQTHVTRQEALDLWVKRNKTSYAALGRLIGVSRAGATGLFKADRAPVDRVEQMRKIRVNGSEIPEELLPKAEDVKPGPKPQADISFASA